MLNFPLILKSFKMLPTILTLLHFNEFVNISDLDRVFMSEV